MHILDILTQVCIAYHAAQQVEQRSVLHRVQQRQPEYLGNKHRHALAFDIIRQVAWMIDQRHGRHHWHTLRSTDGRGYFHPRQGAEQPFVLVPIYGVGLASVRRGIEVENAQVVLMLAQRKYDGLGLFGHGDMDVFAGV